jgi:hypothetical protein
MNNNGRMIERIERLNACLVVVAAALGWSTGVLHAPSIAAGGAAMGVNFWLLKKVVRALLSRGGGERRAKVRALIWLVAKSAAFFGFLGLLLFRFPFRAGSFGAGVSLLPLACVIVALCPPDGSPGSRRREATP